MLTQIFFCHALGYIWRRHFKNTEKAGNSNILQLQQRATTAAELLTAAATEKKLQLQQKRNCNCNTKQLNMAFATATLKY